MDCDIDLTLFLLRTSQERVLFTRALSRGLRESITNTMDAIVTSQELLRSSDEAIERLRFRFLSRP
jgi:hypothetical protein